MWGIRLGGMAARTQGEDAVFVSLADSAVAGMKIRWDGFDGENSDAWWEAPVERAVEVRWRDGRGQGEGSDLAKGVDAGIGTARTLGQDAFADGPVDGVGEEALDGRQIGLDLPPIKSGAIVGEDEFPVSHAVICTVSRVESLVAGCPLFVRDRLYSCTGWGSGLESGGLLYLAFGEWRRTSGIGTGNPANWNQAAFRFVARYAASARLGILAAIEPLHPCLRIDWAPEHVLS
jgi:hypothetical protein